MFNIATGISSIEKNRKTRLHICSFHFLKMNRESIQKLYGKKDDTGKVNFCLRIIGRLICCQSLEKALEICKLVTVVMTNEKVITVVEKLVQELKRTINCFDMLPQIEKDAGCYATNEDVQEVIIEAATPWNDF